VRAQAKLRRASLRGAKRRSNPAVRREAHQKMLSLSAPAGAHLDCFAPLAMTAGVACREHDVSTSCVKDVVKRLNVPSVALRPRFLLDVQGSQTPDTSGDDVPALRGRAHDAPIKSGRRRLGMWRKPIGGTERAMTGWSMASPSQLHSCSE